MIARRQMLKAGAVLVTPLLATLPTPAPTHAVTPADEPMLLTVGPAFDCLVLALSFDRASGINASGRCELRKVNGCWLFLPSPELRAALDAEEHREINRLMAAGLPAVERW